MLLDNQNFTQKSKFTPKIYKNNFAGQAVSLKIDQVTLNRFYILIPVGSGPRIYFPFLNQNLHLQNFRRRKTLNLIRITNSKNSNFLLKRNSFKILLKKSKTNQKMPENFAKNTNYGRNSEFQSNYEILGTFHFFVYYF